MGHGWFGGGAWLSRKVDQVICMRIIHAHKYFYERRGAERYMFDLMRLQEEAGHSVAPFAMHYPKNQPTPWADFFVSEVATEAGAGRGLAALRQFSRALWSREAERQMSKLIAAFQPDICHVHNIYTHISPSILRACARTEVPVVMTVHDYALASANYALWDGEAPLDYHHFNIWRTARTRFIKKSFAATFALDLVRAWHQFTRAYDRYIDQYFAVSEFVKDVLVANKIPAGKIAVQYNFVESKQQLHRYQDQGYVLYVGALEKYKGVQTLIEAMHHFPTIKLKIAGQGDYESELRGMAEGLDNVEFLGFVAGSALQDLMARARVQVVPSLWYEPFGLVVVEAMAQSTPVIVADRGGLPEIVEDGVSGCVFRAGDANDLAQVLVDFFESSAWAQSMGEAAQVRAVQIADAETHFQKIMAAYQRTIDKRRHS